jgi:alpha,alpha-trehalase
MSWKLVYEGFDPATEGLREALCTLGNGRFCTRGATLDATADDVHYPGTYLAGGYDRRTSEVAGHEIENEDLVNWPNWLPVHMRIEDGPWLRTREHARDYRLELDMQRGILVRTMRLAAPDGRALNVTERRFVSMAAPLLAAVELRIAPLGWSGRLNVRSALDGRVRNLGVPRYGDLESCHVEVIGLNHPAAGVAQVYCRTLQSRLEAAMAARTETEPAFVPQPWQEGDEVGTDHACDVEDGRELRLVKTVAFATARDPATASPLIATREAVETAPGFDRLLADHERAWAPLWDDFDISLTDGNDKAQQHLRLNTFHLVQTVSPHSAPIDAGAPARGWHGEAYRGHIFWDELFIFRALNLRAPRLTRSLLDYRLRRLPAARRLAAAAGLPGAMYPWQSGSDGREESQAFHLNPKSGRWVPDATRLQRHVGLAVAYNMWTYFRATGDRDFLAEGGAEALVEIARFFAALATWDDRLCRFRIKGVMGPDEFHTAYPGADPETAGGIDDNAYTNVLCAWVLTRTVDALEELPPSRRRRLAAKLGLEPGEIGHWQQLSELLYVPFLSNGLIAQFEGYEDLRELDWEGYRARHGDIHRLDRILEAKGEDVNAYKVSKQADVLMLPFLFSAAELRQILEQLGYVFDPADIPAHVAYYDARTSHGSTLSRVVHAWVVARSNRPESWELLKQALRADVVDVQGGTTREGIHLGAMAGTIDMLQAGYLGIAPGIGMLNVDPVLPDALTRVRTRIRYMGQHVELEATPEELRIATGGGTQGPITVTYRGRNRLMAPNTEVVFRLVRPRGARTPGRADCEPWSVATPVTDIG